MLSIQFINDTSSFLGVGRAGNRTGHAEQLPRDRGWRGGGGGGIDRIRHTSRFRRERGAERERK